MALVDMAKTPEELAKDYLGAPTIAAPDQSRYPYGLCISLCQDELDKLGLDGDCEVGDMIDLRAMAKVTSVSKNETTSGASIRIELQITHMETENESDEYDDEADEAPVYKVKNPYKK